MYKWNVAVLKRIYRCGQIMIFAIISVACSQFEDSNSTATSNAEKSVGIPIPTAINATSIDSCTKTAFMTVDNKKPAQEMLLTDSMATITITGLSLDTHDFEIEFFCNNQQFPQGILLASQSLSKDIIAGGNSFNYPAELYLYPDMDTDGFTNLSELQANTNPNNPASQPVLGVNEKVSDVLTSSTHSPPILVFNDAGDGLAVWETFSGTGRKILYSLYTFVTDQWSVEAIIAAQASSTQRMSPQVATTGSDFAVVWQQVNDDNTLLSINSKFYADGIWTAQQQIVGSEDISYYGAAKLASNGSGYAVVWRQRESQNLYRLHTKVYDPSVSNSWGGTFTLSDPNSTEDVGFNASYQIASNGSSYAITWGQRVGSLSAVYANIFQNGSWMTTAKQLNTVGIDTKQPILASNGSGYQFTWYQFGGTTEVRTRGYENAVWSTSISVKSNSDQVYSNLVMTSNGKNYAIAWTQQTTGIFVNTGINNTWSVEQRLDITTLANAWQPTIGSNQQGYMVTWSQNVVGGERNIYAAQNLDGGATWQGAQLLDTDTGRFVDKPLIASGDSRYAIMWNKFDPSLTFRNVWVSIFDNSWSTASNIENTSGDTTLGSLFASNGRYIFSWEENTQTQASVVATQTFSSSFGPTNYLIQNSHIGSVVNYKIAAADNGNLLTLWRQFHNGDYRLYTRVYENGVWGDSLLLSDDVFFNYYAVSNGSGFLISWVEKDPNSETLYAKLYIDGVWQLAITTAIQTEYWDMRLSSNGTGYALVWVDGFSFFASTFNGTVWSNWGNLGGNNTGNFELRSNQEGYAFTSWDQGITDASVFTLANGWVTSELVQQQFSNTRPIIAANSNNYMAAYLQNDAGVENLYAGFYNGSSWGARQNIDLNSLSSSPTGYQLAATNSEFVAVWQQADLQEANIYANVFTGANWQATPTKLESLPGAASLPMLSVSGNTSMTIWRQQNSLQSDPFNVYANYYDGTTWQSSPVLLEQGSEDVSTDPQITSQGNRFAAIWLQKQAGINDVHIAIFNNNAWRDPIIVDSTISLVIDPKVVSSSNTFSAAWKQVDPNSDPITVELFTRINF